MQRKCLQQLTAPYSGSSCSTQCNCGKLAWPRVSSRCSSRPASMVNLSSCCQRCGSTCRNCLEPLRCLARG
ncbi:hypothetical protein OEZ85_006393 [Tetradesmus obliquus]|uniref:Uncharacterized protein n=1 Tax=Tetradesmus obliquus TaxID=3088 RepID=A0ABY8TUE9_TETOB|nr:hypothetical protein OEZ85_006393 [Tetradesmus obliquus]